ncbi:helix-turn-helix domain-containing protein [Limnohabitans sp.]|uniref:helix-turn-helix domain-containing protein n=1 Tax=Limnohabitans sp. TaxID=1907725 RepID=UPI00333F443F
MTSHSESENPPILSAGQLLREARLKAGVHVAVLSVNLKVPVRQLEALEANEFDSDKGPVFYRGLAASVCRQLNLDPAPVLALLPRPSSQLVVSKQMLQPTAPMHVRSGKSETFQARSSLKVVSLGALLLALTLSFVWMPSPLQWTWLDELSLPWVNPPSPAEVTQEVQVLPSQRIANEASLSTPVVPPSAALVSPPVLSPVLPNQPTTNNNPSVAVVPTPANSVPWVFSASAESWLELRDAQNTVVWSGILKAGETTRIQSSLPVRVVVGRAQAVNVTLRGAPFDLKPHTQVTVARFEVKE